MAVNILYRRLPALVAIVALGSLLCLGLYTWDNKYTKPGTQAVDGLLALSEAELAEHEVHYLVQGWAFYPGILLTPEDFAEGDPEAYMVYTSIGEHTCFHFHRETDDPHGCGSYALRIHLPDEIRTYALELPEIYSAYRLYVNGKLALQMGTPEVEAYTPRTQNRMVSFQAGGSVTLLLAVSDYSHFYSGMVYPPAFGPPLALDLLRGARLSLSLCVSLIGLLGALLACYMGVRMQHRNSLLFSLLCLNAALFTGYPLLHSAFSLHIQPWYTLELLGNFFMALLVIVLQNRLCERKGSSCRYAETTAMVFCAAILCYGLFSAYLTIPVMRVFSLLIAVFKWGTAIYLLATSLLTRTAYATPLFYASVFYAVLLVWDRVLPVYEPVVTGWFTEWGSLVLIVTIGVVLWRDLVTAYTYSLTFAEEHRQLERQLAMQMEYVRQITRHSAENRKLIHDFRQHLRAIVEMAFQIKSEPDTENIQQQLMQYLKEFSQVIPPKAGHVPFEFCNHTAVDALLQYYYATAQYQDIQARLIFQIPAGISLSDAEWCSVLGNLLENAIEGCGRQKVRAQRVSITVHTTPQIFFLKVENTYDGQYQRRHGRFLSRKSDQTHCGIGLESVRETIERHSGTLDIYPLEDIFRVGITLPILEMNGIE